MPKDPRSGTSTAQEDKLFALLIKERAGWVCEDTGKRPPEVQLQCAHVFTRGRKSVRWDPRNAFCLSAGRHMHYTDNPFEWVEFVTKMLGTEKLEQLRHDSNEMVKYTHAMKAGLRRHLKAELEIIRVRRANGETGWIDFKAFNPNEYEAVVAPARKPKAKRQSKYVRKVGGGVVLRGVKSNLKSDSEAA